MPDITNHADNLIMLSEAQDAEQERRDKAKYANRFLMVDMWEGSDLPDKRYKGKFDRCTPVIDGIAGEMIQSDFTLRTRPSGGDSSEDTAETIDGMIRNIRNISNAETIFRASERACLIGGFDCWEVTAEYSPQGVVSEEDDLPKGMFDQDLMIRSIANALDSVWWGVESVQQDRSDAKKAWKLAKMPVNDYKELWPDGSGMSVGDASGLCFSTQKIDHQIDSVTVGQLFYKKKTKREFVRLSNGKMYEVDEAYEKVADEHKEAGITEVMRRKLDSWRVWTRKFDGGGWLEEEKETVFDWIPLIPIYGNFSILDNAIVFFGKLDNLIDPQMALNYYQSRELEDISFSPPSTLVLTPEQSLGIDYNDMNVSRDPITEYNHVNGQPPPYRLPGPQGSPGIINGISSMNEVINSASNTFSAQQGNANSTQSGRAGLQQIEQGNIGSIKWFEASEIAKCYCGKVLLNAMPRVYDGARVVRIIDEDGTSTSMVSINQPPIQDKESQELVYLNDLSRGQYDIVCESGPAFNSQQKEAVKSFEDAAANDPAFADRNRDIWLANKTEPGMKAMHKRERARLFEAGVIPEDDWTDEEKAKVQKAQQDAANQPPKEDPNMLIAQAEMLTAQAEKQTADTTRAVAQSKHNLATGSQALENRKIDLEVAIFERENKDKFDVDVDKSDQEWQKIDNQETKDALSAQQNQEKIDNETDKIDLQERSDQINQLIALQQASDTRMTAMFDRFETISNTIAKGGLVGPHVIEAGVNEAVAITDAQAETGDTSIGEAVASAPVAVVATVEAPSTEDEPLEPAPEDA